MMTLYKLAEYPDGGEWHDVGSCKELRRGGQILLNLAKNMHGAVDAVGPWSPKLTNWLANRNANPPAVLWPSILEQVETQLREFDAHDPQDFHDPCRYETAPEPDSEKFDIINKARHYNVHPSGVECIDIIKHMSFPIGSAIKYLWRADEKGAPIEDLRKAAYYINCEIERRTREQAD